MRSRIPLVDDDTYALGLTQELLSDRGYDVDTAVSVHEASERLSKTGYRVVVTDLKMPDRPGTEMVEICVNNHPNTPVIIVTGHGTIRNAVEALKHGAFEYLSKPVQLDELSLVIDKAIGHRKLVTEVTFLKEELARAKGFLYETTSRALTEVYCTIEVIRDQDTSVLI